MCPIDLSDVEFTPEEREKLENLFQKHANVFTKNEIDLGYTGTVKHRILTIDQVQSHSLTEESYQTGFKR